MSRAGARRGVARGKARGLEGALRDAGRSALVRVASLGESGSPFAARLGRVERLASEAVAKLLGRDFEERLRRVSERTVGGYDPFGLDLEWARHAVAVAAFFHRFYFRTEVTGLERVPQGRVLLIANHSGQVPLDGLVLGAALFLDAEPPRVVRSMVDKWTQTLPFVAPLYAKVGQVVGVPENARRLLDMGEPLLVFPEGSRGISKPFSKRYQLEPFGLGFMRLALETKTPIVPIAVVGGEEQYVSLANVEPLARALRMPAFPIIPQLLVPGLQLPLPTKYRVTFGEPLVFEGDPDDDDAQIDEKVQRVRATIQSMLNKGLRERKSIFF